MSREPREAIAQNRPRLSAGEPGPRDHPCPPRRVAEAHSSGDRNLPRTEAPRRRSASALHTRAVAPLSNKIFSSVIRRMPYPVRRGHIPASAACEEALPKQTRPGGSREARAFSQAERAALRIVMAAPTEGRRGNSSAPSHARGDRHRGRAVAPSARRSAIMPSGGDAVWNRRWSALRRRSSSSSTLREYS